VDKKRYYEIVDWNVTGSSSVEFGNKVYTIGGFTGAYEMSGTMIVSSKCVTRLVLEILLEIQWPCPEVYF
jgi:hypothetical protein